MTPYSESACRVRVSVSRGSSMRSGSGIGTWKTMIWPSRRGVSGTRWRVWMMVASSVLVEVSVVVSAVVYAGIRHRSLRRLLERGPPVALGDFLAQRPHRHQLGLEV